MYKVIITCGKKSISLTDNKNFVLMPSSEGLGLEVNVNLSELSMSDGASLNSLYVQARHISFTLQLLSNGHGQEVRKLLYDTIKIKQPLTVNVITDNKDVFITGYCEKLSFSTNKPITVLIAIVCPFPYWKISKKPTVQLYGYAPKFMFVKNNTFFNRKIFGNLKTGLVTSIFYDGDSDTGAVFKFDIKSDCNYIGVENIDTEEKIIIDSEFSSGDSLIISTVNYEKDIILVRNNVEYNYFSKLRAGSTFFQIKSGENRIKVLLENENPGLFNIFCSYDVLYGGV